MRQKLADVTHVIMLATVQHSLAVASMLAPAAKTVCVDIDPAAVERAVEHQPLQSIGLVTDVEPFLRELADCLSSLAFPSKLIVLMRELLLCPPDYYGIQGRSIPG